MQETAGKATAREFFYRVFLQTALAPRVLRNSNYLLLLGENFRELELLDEMDVPRYRIFSVERDRSVYNKQKQADKHAELGVGLYMGELIDFLHSFQFSDHKIAVFNLDITGSYLNGIEPALGATLDYARRSETSVVATYNTASRDKLQLMEGLKSLAFLMWLEPELTEELVAYFHDYYNQSQLLQRDRSRNEVIKNMVLRHLFWLRSHLDRLLVSSYTVGLCSAEAVVQLFELEDKIWQSLRTRATFPLAYRQIQELAGSLSQKAIPDAVLDLAFSDVQHLTYTSNGGFFQNCWFATFDSDEKLGIKDWYVSAGRTIMANELLMVNRQGEFCFGVESLSNKAEDMVLWAKDDLVPKLRRPLIPPMAPQQFRKGSKAKSDKKGGKQ